MRTINGDIDTLGRCLGAVILEQEGPEFFALEEAVREACKRRVEHPRDAVAEARVAALLADLPLADCERLIHAFSTYFLLINLAEEHARVRRVQATPQPRAESLAAALLALVAHGYSREQALELVASLDLGLTFTAHPTEMRRRTVRAHLEQISQLVTRLEDPEVVATITAHVEALWHTPRLRARHPNVRDEVNAGLAYVEIIASVLPQLERELQQAVAAAYGGPPVRVGLPLSLHSWMGGDRDGNPAVTAEVTAETFALHRERAVGALRRELDRAYVFLSQSAGRDGVSGDSTSDGGAEVAGPGEPYRAWLRQARAQLVAGQPQVPDFGELTAALEVAHQQRSAEAFAAPLSLRARVCGTHLVSLDLREHSDVVTEAIAALWEQVHGAAAGSYTALDETARCEALSAWLRGAADASDAVGAAAKSSAAAAPGPVEAATRSSIAPWPVSVQAARGWPAATERVVAPMRAAAAASATSGPRAFGKYIVSMTQAPSHLLAVAVLARQAGLRTVPVPLFETLHDLQQAPATMRALLAWPAYREVLGDQVQEIMIGYSDSNKDAGFVAASWALHEAQRQLAEVLGGAGVRYRFFHGRGTSIGRGGGPMVRGIMAQPAGTMAAGLRLTEQGEALSAKYNTPALAHRNLEQGLYALVVAAAQPSTVLDPAWVAAMSRAQAASVAAYRALVDAPDFLPFFEAVTPIGEIAKLRIASRPVRRPGASSLANLRAIPWVMAWTQCRANVPGWFGLAEALAEIGTELAQQMYRDWPYFRAMLDNAQLALGKSEMAIFAHYLTLAPTQRCGQVVLDAFSRTVAAVEAVTAEPLLANEPTLRRAIALRNPYIEPIHRLQVELLRQSRARAGGGSAAAADAEAGAGAAGRSSADVRDEALERALVLSLHGIAAGMQNAG